LIDEATRDTYSVIKDYSSITNQFFGLCHWILAKKQTNLQQRSGNYNKPAAAVFHYAESENMYIKS